jgi:hypothetical protein
MNAYIILLLIAGHGLTVSATAVAQPGDANQGTERQVIRLLDKADEADSKYQYDLRRNDSVRSVENAIMKTLLAGLKKSPSSIDYPFTQLRKRSIKIATSMDGRMRTYSWDVKDNSDVGATSTIVQYRTQQGIESSILFDAVNDMSDDPGTSYTRIHTVRNGDKVMYLAFGFSEYSKSDQSQRIRAFEIEGNRLVDTEKVFKQEGATVNELEIYYDWFYYLDHGRPEIHFDSTGRLMYVPITRLDKFILPRYRKYYFSRNVFRENP